MIEFLKQLEVSKNILHYTFFLDWEIQPALIDDIIPKMDDINKRTFETFSPLFNDGAPYFFGHDISLNPSLDMSILCTYEQYNLVWQDLFKHHAIFTSFSILRSLIGEYNPITSYTSVKLNLLAKANDKKDTTFENSRAGLDYLIEKKAIGYSSPKETLTIKSLIKLDSNTIIDMPGKSSNFARNVTNINKYIRQVSKLKPECLISQKSNKKRNVYLLSNLEIITLLQHNKPVIKNVLKPYSFSNKHPFEQKDYSSYCESRYWIQDYIENNKYFLPSDKLYLKAQIEELFNFDLIDMLFFASTSTSEALNKDLTTQAELDFFMGCSKLPNYFSRTYLIQMIFDCCKHIFNRESIFFKKYYENRDVFGKFTETKKHIFEETEHLNQWHSDFNYFIKYMVSFAFPIYTNLFMCILFDDIAIQNPDMTEMEMIESAYKDLSSYLCKTEIYDTFCNFDKLICEHIQKNHPKFSPTAIYSTNSFDKKLSKSELDIYHRCILAVNDSSTQKTQSLLDKAYLYSIANHPDINIQSYFVLGSIQ